MTPGDTYVANATDRGGNEPWLFWVHLSQAGLIGGLSNPGIVTPTATAFGATHPTGPLVPGYLVRSNPRGTLPPGSTSTTAGGGPTGILVITAQNVRNGIRNFASGASVNMSLSTHVARMIDSKGDDGNASTGDIQAGGTACYAAGTNTSYDIENSTPRSCNLFFSVLK